MMFMRTVVWDSGSAGNLWHNACKREIPGMRMLEQAINRKRKSEESQTIEGSDCDKNPVPEKLQMTTRIVNRKDLCI